MKIHEYQAASLFDQYGIPTLPHREIDQSGIGCVPEIFESLGGHVVIKAQVLVGGRGKAGGVKLARRVEEAAQAAKDILGMEIKGIPVQKIMLAQAISIKQEYYVGITIDRSSKKIVFIASAAGGVDIEELAVREPDKIYKMYIHPFQGPNEADLDALLTAVFRNEGLRCQAKDVFRKLYQLFCENDCSIVEINPFAEIEGERLVAADAKINFDDNALMKHAAIAELKNPEEYTEQELQAQAAGLSFVSMDGNIGCIVNGAGLAMATMDIIKLCGGDPANFLDVGGSSNPEKVLNALRIILSNPKVRAILINIFGGITRCDDIAKGILIATQQIDIRVPLVIRLVGTNQEEGQKMLEGTKFEVAEEMTDAVRKVVKAAQ